MLSGRKSFLVIFLVVVFAGVQARAQGEYLVEPFVPGAPLCSSTVTHILQDNKGFMWFGTPDGVDRYDGYETLHIPFAEGDSGYGNVRTLCEDAKGNMWIGSYKGICVWSAKHYFRGFLTLFSAFVQGRSAGVSGTPKRAIVVVMS